MDSIKIVMDRMRQNGDAPALYWQGLEYNYTSFCDMIDNWQKHLAENGINQGTVCGVLSDYSPQTCALFFALMQAGVILVPFTRNIEAEMPAFMEIAGVQFLFRFDTQDKWTLDRFEGAPQADLVLSFREQLSPGLIVFTSGSTGKPKGILHDCERVMRKFVTKREGWRTVLFLMMDHFIHLKI